jgi:hypothetical protein
MSELRQNHTYYLQRLATAVAQAFGYDIRGEIMVAGVCLNTLALCFAYLFAVL